jgi:SAM-dependent methyltransferase
MDAIKPHRTGVVTAKRPKRSGGAAKPLDDGGPMWLRRTTEPLPMFSMNSFEGMRILSLVREGDYAHAGEEESIELAMKHVPKCRDKVIVDAGCGRGGTAEYIRKNGWGRIIGFDIEPTSIETARRAYPNVEFHVSDVSDADATIKIKADVICMFNAFYCFPDQARALRSLRKIAKPDSKLVVFDHVDRGGYDSGALMDAGSPFLPNPLELTELPILLSANGWTMDVVDEVHSEYIRWYAGLVSRIELRRVDIVAFAGDAGYDHVHSLYRGLLNAALQGTLGAAIVAATPNPRSGGV